MTEVTQGTGTQPTQPTTPAVDAARSQEATIVAGRTTRPGDKGTAPKPRAPRGSKGTGNGKPSGKTGAPKATAPKPAASAEGPKVNERKNIAYMAIVDAVHAICTEQVARKLFPDMPAKDALRFLAAECGRNLSYGPGSYTSPRFVQPGTGRGQRHVATAAQKRGSNGRQKAA